MDEAPDQPHRTSLVVWDVPPTIERGETFRVRLGIKCSSSCRPDKWTLEVRDQDGQVRASAEVGGDPWPGTAGLHGAEVDLIAPDAEGLHSWEARATMAREDDPHTGCIAPLRVRVVPDPEFVLTVAAFDAETESPVAGAKVFAHPYEAYTDEHGEAELRLPKGGYRLFVSGRDHVPFRVEGDLTEDVTIRAELALDRELSDADIWF